jgi:hypothetical protein
MSIERAIEAAKEVHGLSDAEATADNKYVQSILAVMLEDDVKIAQEELKFDALEYLAKTDWYVSRKAETGKIIPEDVLRMRANARAAIV